MKTLKTWMTRIFALALALVLTVGMIPPVQAEAATISNSVSTVSVNTSSGNYYIVRTKNAALRSNTGRFYTTYAKLARNTLIQVCGSTGSFYKVNMNGTIYYIRKADVQKAGKTYNASLCYTTKSSPVRATPYENGSRLSTQSKGAVLKIVGNLTNMYGNTWFVVAHKNGLGYIYKSNIKTFSKLTLKIKGADNTVDIRESLQLKVTANPSAVSGIVWSSSNTKIAKVNIAGVVTGVSAGTVEIRASINGIITASYKIKVTRNVRLDVDAVRQTKDYTCSAAASLAVLRYYGKAGNVSDTTLYRSTSGTVYKIRNVLNNYLGKGTYRYNTFTSLSAYENAIRNSLAQGSPVIARVAFGKGYFNYRSSGHYTTIIGIYDDASGRTWVTIADSYTYTQHDKDNQYCDASEGIVQVPLSEMYRYGSYGGTSNIYLIYNP